MLYYSYQKTNKVQIMPMLHLLTEKVTEHGTLAWLVMCYGHGHGL